MKLVEILTRESVCLRAVSTVTAHLTSITYFVLAKLAPFNRIVFVSDKFQFATSKALRKLKQPALHLFSLEIDISMIWNKN